MMLIDEVKDTVDKFIDVAEKLDKFKELSVAKNRIITECSRDLTEKLHVLEADDALTDERAAEIALEIRDLRRKRRENKNFLELIDPLIVYMAKHNEAMDALLDIAQSMKKLRTNDNKFFVTQNGEVKSTGQGTGEWENMPPPKPVIATTAEGTECYFGSVAAAMRAFCINRSLVLACCYGKLDNVDGTTFRFAEDGYNPTPSHEVHDILMNELTKKAPEPEAEPKEESTPQKKRTNAKPVRFINTHGIVYEYASATEAEHERGINRGEVSRIIRTKAGNGFGGLWEYITD